MASCTTSSGFIGNRRNTKQAIESNRYRPIYALKYYILAAILAMACLWILPTVLNAPAAIAESYNESALADAPEGASIPTWERAFAPAGWIVFAGLASLAVYAGLRGIGKIGPKVIRGYSIPTVLLAVVGVGIGIGVARAGVAKTLDAFGEGVGRSAEAARRDNATLQIGLLDPIALTVRSMTTSVLPTVDKATEVVYSEAREYWFAWVVGLIFIGFPGRQLVHPAILLPGGLPPGGIAGHLQPVRALADRPRPGPLHRLRPLPEELRGGLRPP